MKRLKKNIELSKDAFIVYCAVRFNDDVAIQNMIQDIKYLESKKQVVLASKRRNEDKKMLNSKFK